MFIWIIQDGEPLPGIDQDARDWRAAMLSKALVAAGHEVLWWASTFDHSSKKHRFSEACTIELMSGLRVRLLHGPGYTKNKTLKRFCHHRILASLFAKEAASAERPDLIYGSVPTLELAEQAVLHAQKIHVPVVIDVRDLWPDLYVTLVPEPLRWLFRAVLASEFQRVGRIFQGATSVITISNAYLDWAMKYARRQSNCNDGVFPMGYINQMDESWSKEIDDKQNLLSRLYSLETTELVLTFVGSFTASFDLETVIEAARIIERDGQSNVRFVFVGEGDMGRKLRTKAQGLDNIVFTGWFDRTSVAAVLNLSHAGLAPYDNPLISLPNKPYEYMAAGLPLLSSLHGELEDLILNKQIGLQYQAGNVDSLVQQIYWLATHPVERQAMGKRARKLFEERFRAGIIYPALAAHLELIADRWFGVSPRPTIMRTTMP